MLADLAVENSKHWYNIDMDTDNETKDYSKPVAYDANGQPLYAHPPADESTLHTSAPAQPIINDSESRHAESKHLHPELNLSDAEYIIATVRRHPIALAAPFGVGLVLIAAALSFLLNYDIIVSSFDIDSEWANPVAIALPVFLFSALVALGMYVAYFVYNNNRFYLTNESIIQKIQFSLLAKQEQTISLGEVEDVNYSQRGILQLFFNYGVIRLSTTGDEHTYKFLYVAKPKQEAAVLNNAVEAFKNGRHVG